MHIYILTKRQVSHTISAQTYTHMHTPSAYMCVCVGAHIFVYVYEYAEVNTCAFYLTHTHISHAQTTPQTTPLCPERARESKKYHHQRRRAGAGRAHTIRMTCLPPRPQQQQSCSSSAPEQRVPPFYACSQTSPAALGNFISKPWQIREGFPRES